VRAKARNPDLSGQLDTVAEHVPGDALAVCGSRLASREGRRNDRRFEEKGHRYHFGGKIAPPDVAFHDASGEIRRRYDTNIVDGMRHARHGQQVRQVRFDLATFIASFPTPAELRLVRADLRRWPSSSVAGNVRDAVRSRPVAATEL
jgi:hypothetical protein